MSVEDDKAFDDQIEKMKLKNQHILEKFHASEEDRKRAENHGATIKRDQNMSIRLKPEDFPKLRNNKSNMPRPKSFHDKINHEDQFHASYNQFNDNRKSIKLKNNKSFNEERAYQDYMHFQQVYSVNRNTNNNFNNRFIHRQNSHPNNAEEVNFQKFAYQDKFNNQNIRNKSSQRFAQINHNSRTFKENDSYNPNYIKISKDNEFHGQTFHSMKFQRENDNFHHYNSKYNKDNDFHSNPQKFTKENEYHNYKVNPHHNKEQFQKPYNGNSNQNSKRRPKSKTNSSNNNNNNNNSNHNKPIVNGSGDANVNTKKKSLLDDEYIDDTLEDLEQYRLKVDMEDFIVIDPESPDPILAMPLKPWTNNDVLNDLEAHKSDGECKSNDTVDDSKSVNSINNEFSNKTKLSDEENVQNQISEEQTNNCKSEETQENRTQLNVANEEHINEIGENNNLEDQQLEKDLNNSENDVTYSETNSNEITVNNTANSEHDSTGSINDQQ